MGCPEPECRNGIKQFIGETKETLYGTGVSNSGLIGAISDIQKCMRDKLPRKAFITTLVTILVVSTPFILLCAAAWKESNKKVESHEARIAVLTEQYKNVKEMLCEIRNNQFTKEELKTIIRQSLEQNLGTINE